MQKQTLNQILENIPIVHRSASVQFDFMVEGIQYDSRMIEPGQIFVALEGGNVDGHNYIEAAANRGAVAAIGSQSIDNWVHLDIPYLQFENSREALAYISASYYGYPSRSMVLIGVTGTDGKTTTSNLIYEILRSAGFKAGVISTVNAQIGEEVLDTGFHVTTPEAPDVQYYLWRMKEAGLTHVVLEATSHGLAQHRVTGCDFDMAVVTNITHEHLDYHGSYPAYLQAKGHLFESLHQTPVKSFFPERLAVINKDDSSSDYLESITRVQQIRYSIQEEYDIWAEEIQSGKDGVRFKARGSNFAVDVHSHLPGDFNISNVLAALSVGIFGLKINPDLAVKGIENMQAVPGRMEQIRMGQPFQAIVDFAHTPNALENAINTVRKITDGRVITIFGSAGLRDREKRRMMAEKSAQLADITIITAEDPRTENLDSILAEMQHAAENQGAVLGENLFIVPDRGNAIELGVQIAKAGDLVLACGKGHEQSMCFGETEYHWDDRIAMRAALSKLLNIPGPEMPFLPTRDQ
ncbi:MAG: UDP-N-acetylmuramoyl-L-alanyl-D-glutamate--2,6-diaminopimelate ligase [Anaerolineaceae bacterium]|nr:UDP-N-acetylmuramoyl-L-alanyl-D-glutamate--2,6-diaminopimelate ligase [Anaerolineaceae bacterium]